MDSTKNLRLYPLFSTHSSPAFIQPLQSDLYPRGSEGGESFGAVTLLPAGPGDQLNEWIALACLLFLFFL